MGKVKTRLIPVLGEDGATEFYKRLLVKTLDTAAGFRLCPIELWCSPDANHAYFQKLSKKYSVKLHSQEGKDLGERIKNAFTHTLQYSDQVVIIGCDCPPLTEEYLEHALHSLKTKHGPVFGPAEDGGYVLIGLSQVIPALFEDIEWGGEKVLERSLHGLSKQGIECHLLPVLWDVDRAEDLPRARQYMQQDVTF